MIINGKYQHFFLKNRFFFIISLQVKKSIIFATNKIVKNNKQHKYIAYEITSFQDVCTLK